MNSSDEKAVKDIRQREKNDYDQLLNDLKDVLKTPEGFRFFVWFFKEGNLTDISMTGNSWTFFNEGHRNFAKKVYNILLEADEESSIKVLSEVMKEKME